MECMEDGTGEAEVFEDEKFPTESEIREVEGSSEKLPNEVEICEDDGSGEKFPTESKIFEDESSSSYHPKQVEGLPPKKTLQQVESSIEGADLVEDDQRENQLPVLQTLCHHLSSSSASIFGKEARGEGGGVQGDDNQASIQGFPCHDKSPG